MTENRPKETDVPPNHAKNPVGAAVIATSAMLLMWACFVVYWGNSTTIIGLGDIFTGVKSRSVSCETIPETPHLSAGEKEFIDSNGCLCGPNKGSTLNYIWLRVDEENNTGNALVNYLKAKALPGGCSPIPSNVLLLNATLGSDLGRSKFDYATYKNRRLTIPSAISVRGSIPLNGVCVDATVVVEKLTTRACAFLCLSAMSGAHFNNITSSLT